MPSWPASASASAALPTTINDCALSNATGTTLTVTFTPVVRNFLYHQERHAVNGTANWSSPATILSGGVIGGLDASTNYDVQVRAVGPVGNGDWSNTDTEATTGGTLPGNMSAPAVAQVSSSALSVTFSAASDAVSHEERHAPKIPHSSSPISTGWWSEPATITSGSNITGLDPLIIYEVQTRGVNGVGNGAWSSSGTASTATASGNKNGYSTSSSTMGNNADALLAFRKWTFSGSPNIMTYSFPQASSNLLGAGYGPSGDELDGFSAMGTTQANFVRRVLFYYQQMIPIKFVEITETDSTHAVMRYMVTNGYDLDADHHRGPQVAWAYYPEPGEKPGDVWFHPNYTSADYGHFNYKAIMHETGHALGLKHPSDAGGGGSIALGYDTSIMKPGGTVGYDNPQTPMRNDIRALQFMYGARTDHTGDRIYTWSPTTGEFKINNVTQWSPGGNYVDITIWDGGTNDTYDFSGSGYIGVTADLDAGDGTTCSGSQLGTEATANVYNAYDSDIDQANI